MAKKVACLIKLHIPAGKATTGKPVGTSLGPRGVNIMGFCKEFNARTQKDVGYTLPVIITVYTDKSFTFVTKSPVVSDLLKKVAQVEKGSSTAGKASCGTITMEQLREIAKIKMSDLNAYDEEAAVAILSGSARSMGLEIVS